MKEPKKKRLVKKFHLKSHLFAEIYFNLFVISVNSLILFVVKVKFYR